MVKDFNCYLKNLRDVQIFKVVFSLVAFVLIVAEGIKVHNAIIIGNVEHKNLIKLSTLGKLMVHVRY